MFPYYSISSFTYFTYLVYFKVFYFNFCFNYWFYFLNYFFKSYLKSAIIFFNYKDSGFKGFEFWLTIYFFYILFIDFAKSEFLYDFCIYSAFFCWLFFNYIYKNLFFIGTSGLFFWMFGWIFYSYFDLIFISLI
jgi:hypothetical protein